MDPDSFNVITADPPWNERGGGKIKRGADKHYGLMKTPDILQAMLRAPCWRPASNSVLVMWTTMMSLAEGLWLMEGLGFRYTTHGVWVKTKPDLAGTSLDISIGQYFRGAHELFLVGTRGSGFAVKTDDKGIPSVLFGRAPRENGERIHSRKPPEFTAMIERRFRGPYLEMFARKGERPGWSYWGNEYQKEIETDEHDEAGDDAADETARDAAPSEPEAA